MQQFLFDFRARAPAAAVDYLLVGQHRILYRIPVDPGFAAIGEARLEEVEKHLLFVFVVFRLAGRQLAAPVERQAHGFKLVAHDGDVFARPFRRMDLVLEGGVLRRQAEGIPAHGVQDIETLRALIARDDVAHGVVPDMAHMDPAGRVGEHFQYIIFRPRGVLGDFEDALVGPDPLPFGFGFLRVIAGHGAAIVPWPLIARANRRYGFPGRVSVSRSRCPGPFWDPLSLPAMAGWLASGGIPKRAARRRAAPVPVCRCSA